MGHADSRTMSRYLHYKVGETKRSGSARPSPLCPRTRSLRKRCEPLTSMPFDLAARPLFATSAQFEVRSPKSNSRGPRSCSGEHAVSRAEEARHVMQKITVSQFERALADREKFAAGRVPGQRRRGGRRDQFPPSGPESVRGGEVCWRRRRIRSERRHGGRAVFLLDVNCRHVRRRVDRAGNSWVKIDVADHGQDAEGRIDRLIFYYLWRTRRPRPWSLT